MPSKSLTEQYFKGEVKELREPIGNLLPVTIEYSLNSLLREGYVLVGRKEGNRPKVGNFYTFSHAVLKPACEIVNLYETKDGIKEQKLLEGKEYLIFDDFTEHKSSKSDLVATVMEPCSTWNSNGVDSGDGYTDCDSIAILKKGGNRCAWVLRQFENGGRIAFTIDVEVPNTLCGIKVSCDKVDGRNQCQIESLEYKISGSTLFTACVDAGIVGLCQDNEAMRHQHDSVKYQKGRDAIGTSASITYGGQIETFWITENCDHLLYLEGRRRK
jgi:hypothetical protein